MLFDDGFDKKHFIFKKYDLITNFQTIISPNQNTPV